jgi:hypothetical protein
MAMLDAAAARRLEVLGAARVEAAAGVYDTPLRSEPTRPNAPTAGAKAAELATAHASKIDLTNAIVPVAAADFSVRGRSKFVCPPRLYIKYLIIITFTN